MEISPVSNKRVYQSIIEQFIGLIREGKLKVGEKLPPERILAEMFKVSRPSVREAFRSMEIIGLLEVKPGGGTYITDLNIANFINAIAPLFVRTESMENDLLEFRKLLELEAVRLAADKRNDVMFLMLEDTINQMKVSIEKNDINLGAEADIKFHKAIFLLSGNYILIKAAECVAYILESSVRFNREKILKNTNNARILLGQHVSILNAIKSEDSNLSAAIMLEHLEFVKSMV